VKSELPVSHLRNERLATRRTTILPTMTLPEALETTRIHSVAGLTGARFAPRTTPSRMWG
jgi:predicted ATPase with chaperone activity